jgi:heme/copper-type cytochrome/quinol oxidase subunit 3
MWEVPLLNTVLLLSSGATVTVAHHGLIQGNRKYTIYGLLATILLAILFTGFQGFEYINAPFTIADSVYGSTFYLTTGFHGYMMPLIFNSYSIRKKRRTVININCKYFSSFLERKGQNNLTLFNKNKEAFNLD